MPECVFNTGFSARTLSWTTRRGKHCWDPITVIGVVDVFEQQHLNHASQWRVKVECQSFFISFIFYDNFTKVLINPFNNLEKGLYAEIS